MGRKSKNKVRIDNHQMRIAWVERLMPFFSQNGFSNLTMDHLAIQLGISKATFYKYFESKESLISVIVDMKISEISQYRTIFENRDLPYKERFFSGLEIASRSMTDVSNIFLSDLKSEYPQMWRKIDAFKTEALESLIFFYQEGMSLNVFKEGINPSVLVLTDHLMLSSINDPALLRKYQISLKQFFTEYFLMKCMAIFRDDNPEEYRTRLQMIAKSLRS